LLVSLSILVRKVRRLKKQKKKIVFTNGCFDLLHAGHIRLLKKAKSLGDILIVGINSDGSARKLKGPGRPVVSEKGRAQVMSAVRYVDYVVLFSEPTPMKLIQVLSPDILIKGADYEKSAIVGADWVESYRGRVVRVPLLKGRSSSVILKKLKQL